MKGSPVDESSLQWRHMGFSDYRQLHCFCSTASSWSKLTPKRISKLHTSIPLWGKFMCHHDACVWMHGRATVYFYISSTVGDIKFYVELIITYVTLINSYMGWQGCIIYANDVIQTNRQNSNTFYANLFEAIFWYFITKSSPYNIFHYTDVIMNAMASQITGVSIVCSTFCSSADQTKHQSSASLHGLCEGNPPVTGGFPSQK